MSPAYELLADRYGRDEGRRRRGTIIAVVATAAVGVALVVWIAWYHASNPVSAQLSGYVVVSPHTSKVTVDVFRSGGEAVHCEVYAQAVDHATVGEAVIDIPAGEPGNIVVTATITTERPAVNGALRGCAAVE